MRFLERIRRFRRNVTLQWLLSTWGHDGPRPSLAIRAWLAVGRVIRDALPPALRRRIRGRLFRDVDLRLDVATPSGGVRLRVRGQTEVILHYEIFTQGCYDDAIRSALEGWRPGGRLRVLDLGANIGFFALRVLTLCPLALRRERGLSLTLVEANVDLMPELRERLESDNAVADQAEVSIVSGLAGRRSGRATFHIAPLHSQSAISAERGSREVRSDYVDIESLFPETATIDLIKCDIEGAEEAFLETYPDLLRRTRVAVLELHPLLCDAGRCRRLLRDAGFSEPRVVVSTGETELVWVERPAAS